MLPPSLGCGRHSDFLLTELKGLGPESSTRCMQVFHQCFKSCRWGLWAGFFQASCGPFACRDNKSQRVGNRQAGAEKMHPSRDDSRSEKLSKAEASTRPKLNMFPSQERGLEFQVQIKQNRCLKTNNRCSLAMLLSGWRAQTPVQPAQVSVV